MKITRIAPLVTVTVAGALALAACGSDSNSTSSGSTGGSGSSSSGSSADCASGTLKASGSTAQANAMAQWIKDYQSKCSGATITYGGGGSGQGVTDLTASPQAVNFAGSDAALSPAKGEVDAATKACGSQAIDLPMVTGPIALGFNLKGVTTLILTSDEIAKIFTGKITKWNDAALVATNKGTTLPDENITVFSRSDPSGTTQNFESYLAASAPTVYTDTPSKAWTGVGQGKAGNPLVGQAVQSTEGSITYLEWSFAIQNNLSTAQVDNGGGPVTLSADTAGKTVSTAQVTPSGTGDLSLKLDYATKTAGAYPIVLVTYELVCTKYSDPKVGALVKSFMTFIASDAEQAAVHNLGYAALPSSVATQVQAQIAKIS